MAEQNIVLYLLLVSSSFTLIKPSADGTTTTDLTTTDISGSTVTSGNITTTEQLTTSPLIQTTLRFPDEASPPFQGWPDLVTVKIPSTPIPIPPTEQPAGTLPCPYCLKKEVKGQIIVECRKSDIFCGQYDGCWYFTDPDGFLTKGCIDIIPEYAMINPPECSDLYKKGFCVRGFCISCDLYGLGGATFVQSDYRILLYGLFLCTVTFWRD